MLIRIRHETIYDYDRPVFLEPMTIRLVPREDVAQRLIEHDITIAPPPDGMSKTIEQDGATAHNIWFGGTHERLTIVTNALVETRRTNPFDYLITHEPAQRVPASYPAHLVKVLAPFREPCGSGPVIEWSRELGQDAGDLTTAFLRAVTDRIHDTFRIVERPEGAPFAPEKTLAEQMGSCRDVAMLFIAACRAQGIAARFVSGYSTHHPPETTQHELHAWAEVYLPGGGWRGYDPSLGLALADGHVALATGPDHELAAPITGSFRGTEAQSTLRYNIDLSAAETHEAIDRHTPGSA